MSYKAHMHGSGESHSGTVPAWEEDFLGFSYGFRPADTSDHALLTLRSGVFPRQFQNG
jgi:hypothetical protein